MGLVTETNTQKKIYNFVARVKRTSISRFYVWQTIWNSFASVVLNICGVQSCTVWLKFWTRDWLISFYCQIQENFVQTLQFQLLNCLNIKYFKWILVETWHRTKEHTFNRKLHLMFKLKVTKGGKMIVCCALLLFIWCRNHNEQSFFNKQKKL